MTTTVKVRMRKPRRVFTFISDNVELRRDDACIVQTDRGPEWGVCILPPEPAPREMQERHGMRVLRRADERDAQTLEWMVTEENRAFDICRKKIEQHGMAMKLVDVEVSFDKRKVVFLFTADDRIDFRELVRDLAHDMRTRIEMRHIQVRDEAGIVGGLGGCGRELCCSTWLTEFKPISMRMAKKQNLSLNPSKISGQCGRLLCCLAYENDQYEQAKKRRSNAPAEQVEQQPQAPARRPLPAPRADEYSASLQDDLAAASETRGRSERSGGQRDNRRDAPSGRQGGRPGGGGQGGGQGGGGQRPQRDDRGVNASRGDRPQRDDRGGNAPRGERPQRDNRGGNAPGGDRPAERPRQEPPAQASPPPVVNQQPSPEGPGDGGEKERSKKRRGGRSHRRGRGGPPAPGSAG